MVFKEMESNQDFFGTRSTKQDIRFTDNIQ
jgi:hypothetical protein